MKPDSLGRLALLAACGAGFLWGTGALVVNLLIARHGFSPETISFWRFAVGALVLLALFGRPGLWRAVRPQAGLVLAAGLCMALSVLCWFFGIARIGAAVPTLIAQCLPPVLVTLIAVARGRERLDVLLSVILAAAVGGTALIVLGHGTGAEAPRGWRMAEGVAWSVGAALLHTAFSLVSGRLSSGLGSGRAATCLTLVAVGVMAFSGFIEPLRWPGDAAPEAWLLYLGVVTAALALLAFSWSAQRLSPTALTVAILVEPLTAVLLAALLLGQTLGPAQWLGAVLLLSAIWGLSQRGSGRVGKGRHA